MIVREQPGPWQVLFAWQGSVLPVILPSLLTLGLWGLALVVIDRLVLPLAQVDSAPFTVFGIALSLSLGFRNSAAWDRWWEGRRLWGGLVADLRNLAREAEIWLDEPDRLQVIRLSLAFLHLHRLSLRQTPPDAAATLRLAAAGIDLGPPGSALNRIADITGAARRAGRLEPLGARTLAERLASLSAAQAGAERIASTPLPYVYSLLIYRTAYLYCLLLPLTLIGPAGWLTPVFVMIAAYVFLGLAEVAEELALPFGTTPNALPLDAICRMIEASIAPHLGEVPPVPLEPRNHVLT
ncbi:MAG: bestrophin family protein [Gemmobacter sp.]